jgi:hypothetical protein
MPTIYHLRELTPDECEVKGAIAAIQACDTNPTLDAIQQFSNLSKRRISAAIKGLKQPLIHTKTIRGGQL